MIITKPEVEPTGLYSKTQAAEALQISRRTLSRYADAGLIKFKVRKAGGQAIITGAEIIRCWRDVYLSNLQLWTRKRCATRY